MTSRTTSKGFLAVLTFIAFALIAATPAFATPELAFDQGGADAGGFIYWTGNAADGLIGSKIGFFNIKPTDTPLNSTQSLVCNACLLNFETGAFDGALGPFETFKGGGSFTLEGGVFPNPAGVPPFAGLPVGTTLLDGTFSNTPGQVVFSSTGGVFTGAGTDFKHEDLVAFYGLDVDFKFTETTILSTLVHEDAGVVDLSTFDPVNFLPGEVVINFEDGGYLFSVSNADIRNSPLPEPGSTALFLLGLTGLAAVRRRKS